MTDISSESEIAKLKQIDQFKDKLLATVSHDLRTPLNTILYSLSVLSSTDISQKKLNKQVNLAKTNANLLLSLIEDILDYCQMKNSNIKLQIAEFSLNSFMKDIEDIMKIQANLKNLQLILENPFQNLKLITDQRRLKQIILNFLNNAVKFTSSGYIKLSLEETQVNLIKICVEDTGSGIASDKIEKLGAAYATFGTATNNNTTGIGLGLHLSKQLIGMLGPSESFEVDSIIDVGTKFEFFIYANLNQKEDDNIENALEQLNCSFNEGNSKELTNYSIIQDFKIQTLTALNMIQHKNTYNILIVDDNVFNIFVLKASLKKISKRFKFQQCYNGAEAVEQFKNCNNNNQSQSEVIDLIFMDCEMPIMDGYEASSIITEKIEKQQFAKALIIGNTSLLTEIERKRCIQCGMQTVIVKPIELNTLEKTIHSLLALN